MNWDLGLSESQTSDLVQLLKECLDEKDVERMASKLRWLITELEESWHARKSSD